MTSRRSEKPITIILIFALVAEALLLLWHLEMIPWGQRARSREGVLAGKVVQSHNQLRRRSADSLVWEESRSEEPLYFHDSVLTLKQSTALIKLNNNTEVQLSENTLITIEPPSEYDSGEIRLKFARGNLQARNPYQASSIGNEALTVKLKEGSEIEFREVGDKDFEVQVKSGEATVTAKGEERVVLANEMLRVENGDTSKLKLDQELEWNRTPPKRIYSHHDRVNLNLNWTGPANQIVVQTVGKGERQIEVKEDDQTRTLDLPLGNHRVYVRNGERTSRPLDFQVWRAPVLHLLAPLPRDRAQKDEGLTFLWMRSPNVAAYELFLNGEATQAREKSGQNSLNREFAREEDLFWSVYGRDEDGFEIPPLYEYPLYIRDNPFSAPKLKSPSLRSPAQEKKKDGRGAWQQLWNLLLPQAYADNANVEAVFEWENVPGADQYVIEISATPDFRKPVLIQTVRRSEFVWRNFKKETYFWRVAAGNSRGRMGLFSEAAKVDFRDLKVGKSVDGVMVRAVPKVEKPKLIAPPPPPPLPPPEPVAKVEEPPPEPEPDKPLRLRPSLSWQPRYVAMTADGSGETMADISGGAMLSLAGTALWKWNDQRTIFLTGSIVYYDFVPDPKEKYPIQEDISWSHYSLSGFLLRPQPSSWSFGASVEKFLTVKRSGYQEIKIGEDWWVGPSVHGAWMFGDWLLRLQGAALFSSGAGVKVRHEWQSPMGLGWPVIFGFGYEAYWLFHSHGMTQSGEFFLSVGWEF